MNAQSPITAGGGRAPGRLKVSPIVGSLPVLQYCAPEQLLIDESYQRTIETEASQALIRRIAARWDWGLCQPLFVARRADMGLYVVDGQHRLAAAIMRGDIPQLPCVVTHFDSAEQEATAFVALNQQRRPLGPLELFKAALTSGEPTALKVKQCLDEAGLALANTTNNQAMKAGHVANVGGLLRCERVHGQRILATTLKVLARAYPQQVLRYAGSIFPGIVAVVAGELANRSAPADLIDRLAGFVGRESQHAWRKRFAEARIDDPNLTHANAAARVLRSAWVEWSQAQLGRDKNGPAENDDRAPVPATFLKPTETAWCAHCDRLVGGARAAACTSAFCSLKEKAA